MNACVADAVREGREMLDIMAEVSALDRTHKVRHHFLAPSKVCEPPQLPDGAYDLRKPEETYEHVRILLSELDSQRFEVEALGWILGLEAVEEVVLCEGWIRSSAEKMCALADASGTTYGGWDWMSYPPDWRGLAKPNAR